MSGGKSSPQYALFAKGERKGIFGDEAVTFLAWYANEDDIYQIMFNLAENAIKYNVRNGSVFLHLRQEAGEAVFSVEDTGIGIPEEDIPNIFNRFYRVDKARSRAHGGSGLGLSIVRDTVHAHGGTVRVELRETGGSCFTVCFPVYHEKQEEQA